MIVFKRLILQKVHSGHLSIELTEDGTYDDFPEFARLFTQQIGGKKISGVDGPDVRFWEMKVENVKLNLAYEDFPNGMSIMAHDEKGDTYLKKLFEKLTQESDPKNGL
jgi:hypothetical protein